MILLNTKLFRIFVVFVFKLRKMKLNLHLPIIGGKFLINKAWMNQYERIAC